MIVLPPSRNGALISGRAIPAPSSRSSSMSSSVLRVGAGPSATTARSFAAPWWPLQRSAISTSSRTETSFSACACRAARRNACSGRTVARSSSVRAGDVTQIPFAHSHIAPRQRPRAVDPHALDAPRTSARDDDLDPPAPSMG